MGRVILLLEPTAKRFAKRGFEIGDDRSRFKFSRVFSGLRVLSWLNLSKHCQRVRDRLGEVVVCGGSDRAAISSV